MANSELSTYLQQNLVTLLSYFSEQALIIRGVIDLDLFEGDSKTIATELYIYIDRYKEAPCDHLLDLFEPILSRTDERGKRRARTLKRILGEIHEHRNSINLRYTMDSLDRFVRHQEIRRATLTVLDEFHDGQISDTGIARAEKLFTDALRKRMTVFDPGIALGSSEKSLAFLQEQEQDIFPTGIKPLDDEDLGPKRGALHLFVGLPKQGKTWWLIHLGKMAYLHGHRVLHVSLEMSADQISRRYHQALWRIARRKLAEDEHLQRAKFTVDGTTGDLKNIEVKAFIPKHTFDDDDIYKYLLERHKRIRQRLSRVVIKSFPTGQLTMPMLEAYLDTLELRDQYVPDLLMIDYPRLMKMGVEHQRLELGQIVQNLRGIAASRNIAIAAVSQSSRKGIRPEGSGGPPVITMEHIAEDFSQVMTVDVMLTYNQTREERTSNLARIYVAAARDQDADFSILITQQYQTGQFCEQSQRMWPSTQRVLRQFLASDEIDES